MASAVQATTQEARVSIEAGRGDPAAATEIATGGCSRFLSPHQRLVFNAVRLVGFGAEATAAVGFVIGVIALEPFDAAVALEGEDVRRDTVEKPAVVADDDGAARIVEQCLLERAQRVDVEIVGRLVEQQEVGALLQHFGQMHAVALAARDLPDLFLLVRAAEVEQRAIGAAGDPAAAEIDLVLPAGDLLPDRVVRAERVARLVDIAELYGFADADMAGIGLFLARYHAEQRRLARAVRADHADNAARRQPEIEILDQQPVAEALADMLC